MDVRRRQPTTATATATAAGEPFKKKKQSPLNHHQPLVTPLIPLYVTNGVFFGVFFSVAYFLLHRWREKIRNSTPLHVVTLSEMAAVLSLIASLIYLLGFFGIGLVQPIIASSRSASEEELENDDDVSIAKEDSRPPGPCSAALIDCSIAPVPPPAEKKLVPSFPATTPIILTAEDKEVVQQVVSGAVPLYSLESRLGDCRRAAAIRRDAVEILSGKSLEGLPVEGFDYDSILGQCCEMPIGFVRIPVGVAGPLLLDGVEYTVPMATTEGCLVASTNRGCKAIYVSGGASSVVLRDGMTRAPVVRFPTAIRAAKLKSYLEDPLNFDSLSVVFNK